MPPDPDLLGFQILVDAFHQQNHDADQIVVRERLEQDDVVETVEEFGIEGALDFRLHLILHLRRLPFQLGRLEAQMTALLEEAGTQVRGHDDDRVLEIDLVAEPVSQLAVFKHLQQNVEDIRVRLLDFVEQDDGVRVPLHTFGELTAFLIPDIAGRRTDQLGDRMLLHELRHVEPDQALFAAKQETRQRAGDFGLADARRPEEQERTSRTARGLQAGTGSPDGTCQGGNRLFLADDPPMQFVFNAQKFGDLFFFDRGHRDAGPAGDHIFDVLFGHDSGGGIVQIVLLAKLALVFALLAFFVGVEPRLLELVIRDGVLHPVNDELDPLLDIGQIGGKSRLPQFDAGTRFVDQIDRLIRQETVRNIAVRGEHGRFDGIVRVADGMEFLVAIFDAVHDLHGIGFVRRRHFDGLEAAFERAVFFDRFAELGRRCRADALDFTPGKSGFQNIRGVERTLRRTGAHQRVQLIDEDDRVLVFHQLFHDGLQAFLELAAILRAGHDERQIQSQNALVREERGHVPVGNALRQPFHDRGLPHARLTDQNRIVLGAAAENLHHPLQLMIPSDQRIERVVHRRLRQIARELRQQRAFLRAVGGHLFRLRTLQFFPNGGQTQSALMQDFRGKALLFAKQAQQ